MRFNPSSGPGAGRLWRLRLVGLVVALGAIAGIIIATTGATTSAKNVGHAASLVVKSRPLYGTLVAGTVPKNGSPASGGTLVAGQLSGQTPTDIDPIINGTTCSTNTFQFVADMYIPLYYGPKGATPQIDYSQSAALPPVYSNHNTTVTIKIKPGLKWSDGSPVDGQDVAFYYYLLKAAVDPKDGGTPSNWCQYVSNTDFPFNVKSISYSGNTVVMHLTHPVNSTWFTYNQLQDTNGGVYPLPATDWNVDSKGNKITDWATNPKDAFKIYSNLNDPNGADSLSQFATSPLWKVVDGGFKLKSFNTTNSSFVMVPNPSYGLKPKPNFTFQENTYTDSQALVNAMESGSVEVGQVDPATQLGSIPTLERDGFSVYGAPQWGWWGPFLNYKDKTNDFNNVVAQPYIRQVFGQLVDQKALIAGAYHGFAVPAYGPVAQYPKSPYVSAANQNAGWHFNPKAAAATLKAHGWKVVPGGTTTCVKPGTGAHNCGAGIPAGTPIKFVWATQPESAAAAGVLEAEAFESQAKKLGINVTLQFKQFNFLVSNYNDTNPKAAKYFNDWGANGYGGIFTDYYPTEQGVLNTTGSLNMGGWHDPVADKLMMQSTVSVNPSAINNEVHYFATKEPVIFMPIQDWVVAVSKKVGGTTGGLMQLTQQQLVATLLWVNR